MKTPISYYGGKQMLAHKIISILPKHKTYCEAFAGGLAVFFAKGKSKFEIISDTNENVINFYRALKNNFNELNTMIKSTLYARSTHAKAIHIIKNPIIYDSITRAWAFWVSSNMSRNGEIGGSFSIKLPSENQRNTAALLQTKKERFCVDLSSRIENAVIENRCAIDIIGTYDNCETLFYLDPPYFNADMGHYSGYTKNDFENLLMTLSQIKGKFILSSYPSDVLGIYQNTNKWEFEELPLPNNLKNQNSGGGNKKTEVLTYNFKAIRQMDLFIGTEFANQIHASKTVSRKEKI